MKSSITIFLIVLNFIIYILENFILRDDAFMLYFGLNYLFFNGFYWQILTTMFLHANLMHLIMNMAVLYQFGTILENHLGKVKFIFLCFVGGILTSLLSLSYTYYTFYSLKTIVNLVGASGMICVLLGFFSYLDIRLRKGLILSVLLISFVPILIGINVAWYAHIFGFIIGFLFGKLYVLQKR
ncbi:rhomboid family intramembrane serine protease [Campylobacter sp. FMV-PI01]|uniref:Rhomboid family intramembrane serine protease n=1 Tax=Campylobacter portucalensis TaxID=2608384 RepID=A0A6L5WME1_9BACT|nr:rhomboid family intramembrane serine protease [Campylobacter portucalensis]MSN96831.1 rhomboid family intramembrane serine protease [Campylobacter portucalensis]